MNTHLLLPLLTISLNLFTDEVNEKLGKSFFFFFFLLSFSSCCLEHSGLCFAADFSWLMNVAVAVNHVL